MITNKQIQDYSHVKYSDEGVFQTGRWYKSAGIKPDDNYEYMKLDDMMEPGMETFRVSHRAWIRHTTALWPDQTVRDTIERHIAVGVNPDLGFLFRRLKVKDDLIKMMGLKGIRLAGKGETLMSRYAVTTRVTNVNRVSLNILDMFSDPDQLGKQDAYQWYQPDFGDMTGWRMLSKLERPKEGDEYMVWTALGYQWFPIDSRDLEHAPVGTWQRFNRIGFFARRKVTDKEKLNAVIPREMLPEVLLNMIAEDSTNPTIRGMVRNLFHVVIPLEVMDKGADPVIEYIQQNCNSMPDKFFVQFDCHAYKIESDLIRKEYKIFGNDLPPVMKKIKYKGVWMSEGTSRWNKQDIYTGEMDVPDNIVEAGEDSIHAYIRGRFDRGEARLESEGDRIPVARERYQINDTWLDSVTTTEPYPTPVDISVGGDDVPDEEADHDEEQE